MHPVVWTYQWLSTDEASQKIDILDQLDKPIKASHTDFHPKIKKHSERGPKTPAFAPMTFFIPQGLNIVY